MQSCRLVLNNRANWHSGNGKNHSKKHKLFNHWFSLHRFFNLSKKHIHTTIIKSHGSPLLVCTSSLLEQLLEKEAQLDIWAAIYNCIQPCFAQEWGRMGCTDAHTWWELVTGKGPDGGGGVETKGCHVADLARAHCDAHTRLQDVNNQSY